ncbi:helix-turn-helix domain-containing protein [Priestia megaterium]
MENKRSFIWGVLLMDYGQLPNRVIICIDMRSFFASVSSVIRGLDPLKIRLAVVGDIKRSGSVVLAATPLLKNEGIKTGSRLFEIPKRKDIHVVNPSILKKEILYWILQGPHGEALEQMALEGSNASRIREVIDHIINNYEESFRIEELAEIANMSVSSLHRHFKDVTAMSPIQFQKRLRLQEARRLLLAESLDVADVAFRVGYESQSQFSREYSRMFGFPPRVDIKRMREHYV